MPAHNLTPREVEIVRLISLGCTVKEISKLIKLAPSTIDTHRGNAMNKLGVSNMALLTRMAIKLRICKLGETLTPAEKRESSGGNGMDGTEQRALALCSRRLPMVVVEQSPQSLLSLNRALRATDSRIGL